MPHPPHDGYSPVEPLAVVAVVVAVSTIVFGSFLGLFLPVLPAAGAVVAVVLGHLALVRIQRSGAPGRGLALTALAVGYLWLVATILMISGILLFTGYGPALLGF